MRKRTLLLTVVLTVALLTSCRKDSEQNAPGKTVPEATPEEQTQLPKQITTAVGIDMVLIPGGTFQMGSDKGKDDEKPVHSVTVGSFYMDKHEVTQESYEQMTGTNPSKFPGGKRPVEQVSWFDCIKYCNARSEKEGLKPCYDVTSGLCDFAADGYRLPTEAEWEYACRAGTSTAFSFGDSEAKLKVFAWFRANASDTSHDVGMKKANPFGLYDIHGNVAEWCHDVYREDYYAGSPDTDPRGPVQGDNRVLRGGAWNSRGKTCRSARRLNNAAAVTDICLGYDIYGFRCVRPAGPAGP